MTIELAEAMQQALDADPSQPLRVVDPRDQKTYILIREDEYQRMKGLAYDDSEFSAAEAYPLMDAVAAKEGWDDPDMDSYNGPARRQEP